MASNGTLFKRPDNLKLELSDSANLDNEVETSFQGPHDWRKRLRPVQSPIKCESPELQNSSAVAADGEGKENIEEKQKDKTRPLPPWKRDLIERNKKVARLVRRESSGKSKRNSQLVRRESSGRSKRPTGNESPSGIQRKRSFNKNAESAFTQQVVNEGNGNNLQVPRKRISPANSFKVPSSPNVRRTPSDKVDPNDPNIKKRVERVRRARLYLLQQMGPNSFCIVGDSPEHKFKVIIGPQTCSCNRTPHCVHVLFVMLRVFQVAENDPCLWNKQLKNYEVENLFRAYHSKRSLRIDLKNGRKHRKQSSDQSVYPSTEDSRAPSESDSASVREEDDTCPICLLEMLEGESLLKCDHCQNRLHHHCITVWFEECRRQSEVLICPLCRSKWKNTNVEVKTDGDEEVTAPPPGPTLVPPNTRAPSPQLDLAGRLPYAEPIPEEYSQISQPWIEILGSDLVSCLFSRNWSIRETGLKHLGKEITRELSQVTTEGKSGMSAVKQAKMLKTLECCCSVLAFMCNDPVYKVYVGCLKVLRSVLSHTPSRNDEQRSRLQALFKPVIDTIIVKCTDGNRKMSQLSLSTINELAKSQRGELAVGREIENPGRLGLGGITYLLQLVTEIYDDNLVTWQWLLGRLYVIENLLMDFPTEFIPRMSPDGASSDGSLELMGATSYEEDDQPHLYERLLTIGEFAVKAVSYNHARISRMARRVFLLTCRYSVHMESLCRELMELLNDLDFAHKKSLKRQFENILRDHHQSDKIIHDLRPRRNSSVVSPSDTPVSTPRCNSPVTTVSDHHSDAGSASGKTTLPAPPNTPIKERRKEYERQQRSFEFLEEESSDCDSLVGQSLNKFSKSLDDLDSIERPIRRSVKRYAKSSGKASTLKANRSRSRSKTPQRIGPVLETNIDDVIRQQEESKNLDSSIRSITYGGDDSISSQSTILSPSSFTQPVGVNSSFSPGLPPIPPSRLLSHDLETDIDTVELDLKTITGSRLNGSQGSENTGTLQKTFHKSAISHSTPNVSPKAPTSLALDLNFADESPRPISPCAHAKELERLSGLKSKSPTPNNSCSQANMSTPCGLVSKKLTLSIKDGQHSRDNSPVTKSLRKSPAAEVTQKVSQLPMATQKSQLTDDLSEISPVAKTSEKPVTFKSEVASATPKHSPSQTLEKDDDDCYCKEEVEKEEAIALARAMEISSQDPPKPFVPGLTPMDQEEVITVQIQPDDGKVDSVDNNGNPPMLYYENMHWVKGPLLGTGAFSSCYQARDIKTGTIMALKQISYCRNSKSEQDTVIESVTEEIHMMAKLSHPNIIRIMGATRQGCHFNMFVEWMPGGSVSYLLGQYGVFSEDVITSYMLQILRGLAYLHDSHVLHRDLKGANLLIDSTGQRLRIGDFGAAARLASKATGAGEFQGQLLGTIAFMAPEVLRGEDYGRACDVWSCGCCMIEMATTKPPWNAHDISNHLALIFKIANSDSTPPIPDKLSPPQRDVLLRCLETSKEQRPSAKELLIHPLFTQYTKMK